MIYETIIAGIIVTIISNILLDKKKREDFCSTMISFNKWTARKIEKTISFIKSVFFKN
jgi:hypothetical protein